MTRIAYIGGYAGADTPMKGIGCARVDDTGRWEITGSAGDVANPFHLLVAGDVLYAAANAVEGAVHALRLEPDGTLVPISTQPTGGAGTVHLALDPTGRWLLAADHDSGTVSVHGVATGGRIEPARQRVEHTGSGPHPVEQLGPHPHQIHFDPAGRALVPDKGTDSIWVYPFADGELGAPEQVVMPAGCGPRQLLPHPDGRHLYLVGELNSTVVVLDPDLTVLAAVATLPEGVDAWNAPATACLSADASTLYVLNRGHESVAIMAVEDGGAALKLVGAPRLHDDPEAMTLPWDLVLEDELLHTVQLGGPVASYRVDPAAATLTPVGEPASAPTPACLVFR